MAKRRKGSGDRERGRGLHRPIAHINNSMANAEEPARCQLASWLTGFSIGSEGSSRAWTELWPRPP